MHDNLCSNMGLQYQGFPRGVILVDAFSLLLAWLVLLEMEFSREKLFSLINNIYLTPGEEGSQSYCNSG